MTTTALRRTPFYPHHVELGAKLVDFAGWEMPIQYSTVMGEHKAVRERVGFFDISHMGQVWVAGPNARAALDRLVTNDIASLPVGRGRYALLCKPDGGVVDDLYVYCLETDRFLVIINASRVAVDLAWIKEHLTGDVMLMEQVQGASIAVQGPHAAALIRRFSADALALPKNGVAELPIMDMGMVVARTGYTGEDGFEFFAPAGRLLPWLPALIKRGSDYGLIPCGLGARDTLRLEMGYRLYGHDLDEHHTALESGLGWAVKLDKPEFVGQAALREENQRGSSRSFVGVQLTDRGVPRAGAPLVAGGQVVGQVTSGTFSPSLGTGIAMGFVETSRWPADGQGVAVRLRDTDVPAAVVKPPFYKKAKI